MLSKVSPSSTFTVPPTSNLLPEVKIISGSAAMAGAARAITSIRHRAMHSILFIVLSPFLFWRIALGTPSTFR